MPSSNPFYSFQKFTGIFNFGLLSNKLSTYLINKLI
jgi:hypothetical protein